MKNIVFVDDERELLDGLRARLYKHRHDWNMQFLLSGDEAIAVFEQQHVDLIVSDVRMPGMDGGQLLSVVKQRWPNTVRVIVSGYSDPVQAVRLTSLAHQYVAKPCDGQQLENIIERCFNLQDLLSEEPLRKMVGRIGKLPALPKTYGRLQARTIATQRDCRGNRRYRDRRRRHCEQGAANHQFGILPFAQAHGPDQGCGHVSRVCHRSQSGPVLGTFFAMADFAEHFWRSIPSNCRAMHMYAAAACKSLAGGRASADDAWLAGLLHDIGYWILIQECPDELAQALELARSQHLPLFECERRTTGATHAQIGAYLLGLWGLPYSIVEAVAMHHEPGGITPHGYDLLGALAVSHALLEHKSAHALSSSGEPDSGIDAAYLTSLNAPFDWEEAQRRVGSSAVPSN